MNRPNMISCASCGIENNILSRKKGKEFTCFDCGADLQLAIEKYDSSEKFVETNPDLTQAEKSETSPQKEKKYPTLKLISAIFRVLAWIVGIGALIPLFYGLTLLDNETGILIIVSSLICGVLGVVFLLAISEGIVLFVNIANDVNELKNEKKVINGNSKAT